MEDEDEKAQGQEENSLHSLISLPWFVSHDQKVEGTILSWVQEAEESNCHFKVHGQHSINLTHHAVKGIFKLGWVGSYLEMVGICGPQWQGIQSSKVD